MNPRERVLMTLNRQTPDRAPASARFHAGVMRLFNEKVQAHLPERYLQLGHMGIVTEPLPGSLSPEEYFGCDLRQVATLPSARPNDYSGYFDALPKHAFMTEWGYARVIDPGSFSERRISPLRHATSADEISRYPLPDVDADYRWQGLVEIVDSFKNAGYGVAAFFHATFFELLSDLRGYDQLLMDLYTEPEIVEALIDLVTEVRIRQAVGLARSGVDILRIGDNFGGQKRMLVSPDKWREIFKPGVQKLIRSVKSVRPDLFLLYKSDGNIEPIIPDLIEMGVDFLCPVQAESMDPLKLKKAFGERLGMWGTISTQTLLPFGTPEQIRARTWEYMRVLGKGGGLVIGPDQMVLPDVPWENIVAFFDAVRSFKW